MATLSDLRTSISQMPDEEAFELIKQVRFLRRQIPPKKQRKSSTKRKPSKPIDPLGAVKKMSEEERIKLINQLEGEL
jgi:hypothetical protein